MPAHIAFHDLLQLQGQGSAYHLSHLSSLCLSLVTIGLYYHLFTDIFEWNYKHTLKQVTTSKNIAMKKLVLAAFLAVSMISSAFAVDDNKANNENRKDNRVNVRTLHNFRTEFGNLSDVEWSLRS